MSNIPPDLYEHVGELAADITNATLADDHVLAESLYQWLHFHHEEQLAAGRSHPIIIATLAGYTDDPAQAVRYDEQALAGVFLSPGMDNARARRQTHSASAGGA